MTSKTDAGRNVRRAAKAQSVAALQAQVEALRTSNERMVKAVIQLGQEAKLTRDMLTAHIEHVRTLHSNPLFLRALISSIEVLDKEADTVFALKEQGKWVPTHLEKAVEPETAEELGVDHFVKLVKTVVPDGDNVLTDYLSVYTGDLGEDGSVIWKQTALNVLDVLGLSVEGLIGLLEGASEGYFKLIPGHALVEDNDELADGDHNPVIQMVHFTMPSGNGELSYTVTVTTAPVLKPTPMSFSFHQNEAGDVTQGMPYTPEQTDHDPLPQEIVGMLRDMVSDNIDEYKVIYLYIEEGKPLVDEMFDTLKVHVTEEDHGNYAHVLDQASPQKVEDVDQATGDDGLKTVGDPH